MVPHLWMGNTVNFFGVSVKRKGLCQDGKEVLHFSCLTESSRFVRPPTINSFPCDYSFGVYPTMAEKKHAPWGAERMRALQDAKH